MAGLRRLVVCRGGLRMLAVLLLTTRLNCIARIGLAEEQVALS